MKNNVNTIVVLAALLVITIGGSRAAAPDDKEQLKLAAIEALIAAPAERALPLVSKVLRGDHSTGLKERALFILSQMETAEAQSMLLELAHDDDGVLQHEAIRMVGISGDSETLGSLRSIYESGSRRTRVAVLEAYLIADDKTAVLDIASNAEGDDFKNAVNTLGAMDAREELRALRGHAGGSAALIDAYAVSGDLEALHELALSDSDIKVQTHAIEAIGIIDNDKADSTLLTLYRDAANNHVREAALNGMLISDYDAGVLELYRASSDPAEKKELFQYLVMMDSGDIWQIIDDALAEDE